jgi:hypothetical protein
VQIRNPHVPFRLYFEYGIRINHPRDGNHKNNHMINIFKVFKKMLSFVFRIVNMNVNLRTHLSVSSFLEHLSKRCSLLPFAGGRWPVWSCVRHLRGDLSLPTSCQSRIRSYFPTKTILRSQFCAHRASAHEREKPCVGSAGMKQDK